MPMRLVRNHELRLLVIAAFAAALSVVAMCVSIIVRTNQTEQFRQQVASNCRGLESIKTQIRGVFQDNLASVESRTDLDPVQRRAIVEYYTRQIKRFKPLDCPGG